MKMLDILLAGMAALFCAAVYAQQVTPIPPQSTSPTNIMTPYCTTAGAATGTWAGSFTQTASSGVTANVLTVTDGKFVYTSTINPTTGAMTCFVKVGS